MSNQTKKIYLDYAATTPVDKEVLNAMMPYFSDKFGNASSVHSFGQEAIAAIDQAREKIANLLNCDFSEIIFTGSATEANNMAINGLIQNCTTYRRSSVSGINKLHIISTNIEHESVLEPLKELERAGHEITYLKVNKDGFISVSDLEKSIKNNTVLVSIIYANNEIGTIQSVKEIGKLLEKINTKRKEQGLNRIYFHTDAVQAFQFLECRPDWLKVDLLIFSGHKIYGPKGVGGLYVRKIGPIGFIGPIIKGGGQEFGLRSGTENVAGIVGLAKAVGLVFKNRETRLKKILHLRNQLLDYIIKYNKDIKLNGSLDPSTSLRTSNRLPNNLNIRFPNISNETLLIALDQNGLAVSAGSACSARASKASYVLNALGLTEKQAKESIRITIGKDTTEKEIKKAAEIINKALLNFKNLRI
ncbi:MAG: cysteine desulfurase [Parcubacteria group bacterium]|nr:cysteine desulfurase [Parcubacteria group bacterium]